MKKFLFLNAMVVSACILFFSFKSAPVEQPSPSASVKRGEEVYTSYCLACHQANGSGVPNLNPPLIKTKFVLGDKKALVTIVLKGLTGEIQVGDETYDGNMPPHNFLSDIQVADVLTYVRNNFGNKASAVKPAEVKALRAKLKA